MADQTGTFKDGPMNMVTQDEPAKPILAPGKAKLLVAMVISALVTLVIILSITLATRR